VGESSSVEVPKEKKEKRKRVGGWDEAGVFGRNLSMEMGGGIGQNYLVVKKESEREKKKMLSNRSILNLTIPSFGFIHHSLFVFLISHRCL
jgi:hypothetical protein